LENPARRSKDINKQNTSKLRKSFQDDEIHSKTKQEIFQDQNSYLEFTDEEAEILQVQKYKKEENHASQIYQSENSNKTFRI
jgi:hypothetical protein